MRHEALSREELRAVIEGRGTARRVPVILQFWTHPEAFGEDAAAVEAIMGRFPEDAQVLRLRMPEPGLAPAEDPAYRWLPSAPAVASGGLDERILIEDWSGLDAILASFPDPRSPAAFAGIPPADGRYRLAHWWYCLFERHWSLRGMTNALTDFYTDPASVHRLYGALTDFYLGIIDRAALEFGADGIFTSDDIGTQTGPFFSPAIFDEFFAPYYRRMIERAHGHGMHVWLHSCGDIQAFLPRLLDLGLDVLHPIQRYAMDEEAAKGAIDGRLCVWAGFDVQRIIPFGSPQEVKAELRRMKDVWRRADGRFMLTAGNGINGDCPLGSLAALYEEAFAPEAAANPAP